MEKRIEKALEKRKKGYNCSQAVACTYCDVVNMDEETLFKLTEGLGAGGGNMEGTCGAVVGAGIILGLLNSSGNLDKPDSKASTMKLSKEISDNFLERNHTVICKELKGVDTGVVMRSCPDCIKDTCEFLDKILDKLS